MFRKTITAKTIKSLYTITLNELYGCCTLNVAMCIYRTRNSLISQSISRPKKDTLVGYGGFCNIYLCFNKQNSFYFYSSPPTPLGGGVPGGPDGPPGGVPPPPLDACSINILEYPPLVCPSD